MTTIKLVEVAEPAPRRTPRWRSVVGGWLLVPIVLFETVERHWLKILTGIVFGICLYLLAKPPSW